MILGFSALKKAIDDNVMRISLDGEDQLSDSCYIEPASIDLTLAGDTLEPHPNKCSAGVATDLRVPISYKQVPARDGVLVIPALGFLLARTREAVHLPPELVCFVEGRSSVGRAGLFIHNAGWVDPGFEGTITLELFNALPNPMIVPVGLRICQIVVAEVKGEPAFGNRYRGKYQGQELTTGSMVCRDYDRGAPQA